MSELGTIDVIGVVIKKVENGWIIHPQERTDGIKGAQDGKARVAESYESLFETVRTLFEETRYIEDDGPAVLY